MSNFDQQNLNDLSEQLKEFTKGLEDFSKDGGMGGSFDKGTQKIVTALGKLGAELSQNTKTKISEKRYIDEFTKSVEKATKATVDQTSSTTTANRQNLQDQKTASQILKEQIKTAKEQQEAAGTLSDKFVNLAGENQVLAGRLKFTTIAFDGLAKSITQYSRAVYDGQRGAAVAAKSLTTFGEAVGNAISVLSIFLPGGLLAKGIGVLAGQLFPKLISGITKYNELASEQADKLRDTFMGLSKGGVTLQGGLDGTFKAMQDLGMSVAEASEFTNLLAGSAKDLRFLGATAGQGADQFVKIAGIFTKGGLGRELELMGVSQEEQREAALKYMSIQARTGQLQLNNTTALVKSAAQFTKELDLAAELAGNTRKEQLESRERAMSDERWRSAYQEALRTGDTDQVRALELAQAIAGQLESVGDERGAAGIRQLAAGRGAMTTEDAQRVATQYGATDILFNRNNSVNNLGQVMGMMSRNAGMVNMGLAGANSLIGQTQLQTTGVGGYELEALIKGREKAMVDDGFKGTIDEFLKTEAGKKADAKLATQIDTRRLQQSTALMQDKFINSFYDTSKINEAAAWTFKEAVEKFGGKKVEVSGGTFATGGGGGGGPAPTRSNIDSTTGMEMPGYGNYVEPGSFWKNTFGGGSSGGEIGNSFSVDKLLNYIGQKESNGNYAKLVGGKVEPNLTNMTISEVLEYQSGMKNRGHESTAVGKYQIIRSTLQELIDDGYANLNDKFDNATQDSLAKGLLKRRGLERFQSGKISKDLFADSLSKEWASLPFNTGRSYYAGVGSNKSGDSREAFMAQLGARTGGIFRGPSTGYTVELHGDEAVVPMNDGVSKQALNTSIFNQDTTMINDLKYMFETMNYKYDQMIELLSRNADSSEKLVQAAY